MDDPMNNWIVTIKEANGTKIKLVIVRKRSYLSAKIEKVRLNVPPAVTLWKGSEENMLKEVAFLFCLLCSVLFLESDRIRN
mmetsp:Transcript_2810/g.4850  ORF Transcript_2810/g.4850 Transcript_2810/m.4850 type:complete len:81 (-) Transcript_2810:2-244(-)